MKTTPDQKSSYAYVREEAAKLRESVRERSLSYIVAAFSLVAGLAWNDAIRALIDELFPIDKNALLPKFAYAVIVTVVVVLITISLTRALSKENAS